MGAGGYDDGMPELKPGTMVTTNLRLESLLGEGAMGSVWVANHLGLESEVAVKFIAADHRQKHREAALDRFKLEARAAARIKSPHVVHMYDHGVMDNGTPYIVMELLEGESLGSRLRRDGRLALGEVSQIVDQVAKALSKAHALGIVHRDIKPDNLFLLPSEDELFVKVLDFGIAKHTEDPNHAMTTTGAMLGTPLYMSPELVRSAREADYRADLWALAIVAYEALTGAPPFAGETVGSLFFSICGDVAEPPSSQREEIPKAVDTWFSRALRHEPDKRFDSARAMASAFKAALSGSSPGEPAETSETAERAAEPLNEIDSALLATGAFVSQQKLDASVEESDEPAGDEQPKEQTSTLEAARDHSDELPAKPEETAQTFEGAAASVTPTPARAVGSKRLLWLAAALAGTITVVASAFMFTAPGEPDKPAISAAAAPRPQGSKEVPLRIRCDPACDKIEVDGRVYRAADFEDAAKQFGEEPAKGQLRIRIAPGRHRVRISQPGYNDASELIEVREGQPFDKSYALKAKEAKIALAVIKRTITRSKSKYSVCYEVAQARLPGLAGSIDMHFKIDPKGDVIEAKAVGTLGDDDFRRCIEQSFKSLSFPAPEGGGVASAIYPLTFKPRTRAPKRPHKGKPPADAPLKRPFDEGNKVHYNKKRQNKKQSPNMKKAPVGSMGGY